MSEFKVLHFNNHACGDLTYLAMFQDSFKYSYPPLPDDDFQTPICDNGPIVSDDDRESKEGDLDVKDALESSFTSDVVVKPKKVHFLSILVINILFLTKKKNSG